MQNKMNFFTMQNREIKTEKFMIQNKSSCINLSENEHLNIENNTIMGSLKQLEEDSKDNQVEIRNADKSVDLIANISSIARANDDKLKINDSITLKFQLSKVYAKSDYDRDRGSTKFIKNLIRHRNSYLSHSDENFFMIPKKSCLIKKDSNILFDSNFKKRVSFSDFHGKDLFTVRTMAESSDCPPKLNSKYAKFFLDKEYYDQKNYVNVKSYAAQNGNCRNYNYGNLLGRISVKPIEDESITIFLLDFQQPVADHSSFNKKITDAFVSLEKANINNCTVSGTIKVKNISYEKRVFVRCTFNYWNSYEDYEATYSPNTYSNYIYEPFSANTDTFKFEFILPSEIDTSKAIKLELNSDSSLKDNWSATMNNWYENKNKPCIQFCICFKSNEKEYWDNNNGNNYLILHFLTVYDKTNANMDTTVISIKKTTQTEPIDPANLLKNDNISCNEFNIFSNKLSDNDTKTKTDNENLSLSYDSYDSKTLINDRNIDEVLNSILYNLKYSSSYKDIENFNKSDNQMLPNDLYIYQNNLIQMNGLDVPYW